ncbi:transposase [Marinomonas sp. 2405UD68-3]|uniref:transposase n=1 Tax=Marinomonas sp. 2405UD68-3 TaxID=3391835 RepID=UPI0039C90FD5
MHTLNETANFLHGEETFVSANSGYRGAHKRKELTEIKTDWLIVKMPSKVNLLKKHLRIHTLSIQTKRIKVNIRAKVEHPFRIIKRQFGFRKVIYRRLTKNDNKLAMRFALANVYRMEQMI